MRKNHCQDKKKHEKSFVQNTKDIVEEMKRKSFN